MLFEPVEPAQLVATTTAALRIALELRGRHYNTAEHVLRGVASLLDGASGPRLPRSLRQIAALRELSPRQIEVVAALAEHRRVGRVARALSLSEVTVRNHLKTIFAKVGVHSQDELLDLVVGPAT